MNNVHPIFRSALFGIAPAAPTTLEDVLMPCEVDISVGIHAEPIYVTPDQETVKEAAAEVLEKHQRELSDVIVRKVREGKRYRECTP